MRMINADEFLEDAKRAPLPLSARAIELIMSQTETVDLVRCSECKYWGVEEDRNVRACHNPKNGTHALVPDYTKASHYCGYAKRKDRRK